MTREWQFSKPFMKNIYLFHIIMFWARLNVCIKIPYLYAIRLDHSINAEWLIRYLIEVFYIKTQPGFIYCKLTINILCRVILTIFNICIQHQLHMLSVRTTLVTNFKRHSWKYNNFSSPNTDDKNNNVCQLSSTRHSFTNT